VTSAALFCPSQQRTYSARRAFGCPIHRCGHALCSSVVHTSGASVSTQTSSATISLDVLTFERRVRVWHTNAARVAAHQVAHGKPRVAHVVQETPGRHHRGSGCKPCVRERRRSACVALERTEWNEAAHGALRRWVWPQQVPPRRQQRGRGVLAKHCEAGVWKGVQQGQGSQLVVQPSTQRAYRDDVRPAVAPRAGQRQRQRHAFVQVGGVLGVRPRSAREPGGDRKRGAT